MNYEGEKPEIRVSGRNRGDHKVLRNAGEFKREVDAVEELSRAEMAAENIRQAPQNRWIPPWELAQMRRIEREQNEVDEESDDDDDADAIEEAINRSRETFELEQQRRNMESHLRTTAPFPIAVVSPISSGFRSNILGTPHLEFASTQEEENTDEDEEDIEEAINRSRETYENELLERANVERASGFLPVALVLPDLDAPVSTNYAILESEQDETQNEREMILNAMNDADDFGEVLFEVGGVRIIGNREVPVATQADENRDICQVVTVEWIPPWELAALRREPNVASEIPFAQKIE